mgnify:FL=1|jgi:transcription-repair coupling factor (superfamily II helicase)
MLKYKYGNCFKSVDACVLASKLSENDGLSLVIAPSISELTRLHRELEFYLDGTGVDLLLFPDWETLPYDQFSPHKEIISERLSTLYQITQVSTGVVLASAQTLMHQLCPQEYILSRVFKLKVGDRLNLKKIRSRLVDINYNQVSQVEIQGEYAIRGSIIDIYPMGAEIPYRIDLFDDEVDGIRTFDIEDQRTVDSIENINLLPAREFPFDKSSISKFRTNWRDCFQSDPRLSPLYLQVSEAQMAAGLEYYLGLFFDKLHTIFDYLPKATTIYSIGDIQNSVNEFWQSITTRNERFGHDLTRPILDKNEVYIEPQSFMQELKDFPQVMLVESEVENGTTRSNIEFTKVPDIKMDIKKTSETGARLNTFLQSSDNRILFCAESIGRHQILEQILRNHGVAPQNISSWKEFINSESQYNVCVAPLVNGYVSCKQGFSIVTEFELFGRQYHPTSKRNKNAKFVSEYAIKNLAELKLNDLIVHIEHGIGRYKGLITISANGSESEFLAIEYAEDAKLYVPITSLHLVSHYSGAAVESITLHYLGSDKWRRAKDKASKKAQDTAAQLLAIYAKRETKQRQKFQVNCIEFDEFVSSFPYEETEDQIKATTDIINDLQATRPMDRVICGDVGFGKTEVAMRASFIVATSGFQVGILVPTTLLAEQHYQSFLSRFSEFPIEIAVLSRFQNKQEQLKILEKVKEGKIDIVIGTHRLIQDDVAFNNLGLLIIDEEHRFGVKQKEKFKKLRAEIDILTLTATPIPRTLNMAMGGIRGLSIIATPPSKRLSVKTFVREFNISLVQEAIERELQRGGQVFYLYNNVKGIEKKAQEIVAMVKNANVLVAHGQMPEKQLEDTMNDFYHLRGNILVCTTIIETGIDIPTANTIIIERADKFGLAQLHQLRGRVGRSHHQAFAFCLTPPADLITSDAKKRLEAIESLETLGSGFTLASHDLEIRGAGDLLGDDQSGHIQEIGFQLYMDILNKAVKAIKQGKSLESFDDKNCDIDLGIPALIPENFLPDINMRLVLYKRISNVTNKEELNYLGLEMIDRFGKLPEPTENLMKITEFKLNMLKLGINRIKIGRKGGKIRFDQKPKIETEKIINLVRHNPENYRFESPVEIRVKKDLLEAAARIGYVSNLFEVFS